MSNRSISTYLALLLVLGILLPAYGQWTSHLIDGNLQGARIACAADIDGDGDLDVVASSRVADVVVWYEHINDTLWIRHDIDQSLDGAALLCAADIDNDNDIDVIVAAQDGDIVVWYENILPDTSWPIDTVGANIDGAHDICVGDIDNDNDSDVVVGVIEAGVLICYQNPAWTPDTIDGELNDPLSPEIVDMDGDNDMDVVARGDSDIVWYEAPNWTKHFIDQNINNPFGIDICAADIDNDGDQDVVAAFCDAYVVVWYENVLPDSSWPKHTIDPDIWWPAWICVADLDNDGDNDVVAAENTGRRFMWYQNVLPDSNWIPHIIAQVSGLSYPCYVYAADINEDSCLDVVATTGFGNDVIWYENPIPGVSEKPTANIIEQYDALRTTIFSGPLQLPEGKKCKIFDITGRVVEPDMIKPGVYFIEVDGVVTQKVVKVR